MSWIDSLREKLHQPPAGGWTRYQFAALDQLHLGGMEATEGLLKWLPNNAIFGLDMAAGLGGSARLAAEIYQCQMVACDINQDYIQAAKMLNHALMPAPDCQYQVANSLALPFANNTFDFIISQHGMMSIADKDGLMQEAGRVLKDNGYLLVHEIYLSPAAKAQEIYYPTPWADKRQDSYLQTWEAFVAQAQYLGWYLETQENQTLNSLKWLQEAATNDAAASFNARLTLGPKAGTMHNNMLLNLQQELIEVRTARLSKISA